MKRRRRIALVDLGVEFTGASTYLQNLVSLLSDQADFWVVKLNDRLTFDMQDRAVHVVDLGFARRWGRPGQIPLTMCVLLWLRLRHGVDAIWVNGYPEIALMPWARLIGTQAIATRHLTMLSDKPKWHWIRSGWRVHFLYELLSPAAHTIVCVSAVVADSLKQYVRPEKLVVIPNWVPTMPDPVGPFAPRSQSPLRLLFVGRLIGHKGVYLLLQAMRLLLAGGFRNCLLTVVGEGEDRLLLEQAAKDLPVVFAGFHRDTSSFYRDSDVFINPTLGPEGLPLVSLDAMSHGLPLVLSNIPVHKEITQGGRTALLFTSGDAQSLMECLARLWQAPQDVAEYGQLARAEAEANHSPQIARQRYGVALGL